MVPRSAGNLFKEVEDGFGRAQALGCVQGVLAKTPRRHLGLRMPVREPHLLQVPMVTGYNDTRSPWVDTFQDGSNESLKRLKSGAS